MKLTYPNWLGITAEYPALILGKANAEKHKNILAILFKYSKMLIIIIMTIIYKCNTCITPSARYPPTLSVNQLLMCIYICV